MATVTSLTADRMIDIENASVVDGEVVGDDLILTRFDESTINAGNVRGEKGDKGDKGDPGSGNVDSVNGKLGPDVELDIDDIPDLTSQLADKAPLEHTHPTSDIVSGVFPLSRIRVASDLEVSNSKLIRADDSRLLQIGSGVPNGSVTAPVGAMYFDTAQTRGAYLWRKLTGSGNTGWVVEIGDTGYRDVSSDMINSWAGRILVRRINNTVHVRIHAVQPPSSSPDVNILNWTYPGFELADTQSSARFQVTNTSSAVRRGLITSSVLSIYNTASGDALYGECISSVLKGSAWPSSLPGTA